MRKYLVIVIFLVLIALLLWWLSTAKKSSPNNFLGDSAEINLFTEDGVPAGNALISIPYVNEMPGENTLSIWLDGNSDGNFAADEKIIDAYYIDPFAGKINGFYFDASILGFGAENRSQVVTKVVASPSNETMQTTAVINKIDVSALLDLDTVTDPENATKGWSVSTALAQQTIPKGKDADMPDFNQRPGECGPTSAANSLINLINQHGEESQLPTDLTAMLDELKADMNWTPNDGTPPDLFVQGKNAWAARHGLPIRTTKVGDQNGLTTLEAISSAISQGHAVELRLAFADADTLKAAGGHMLTVTGIQPIGNRTFLEVNDPVTPNGTETLAISQNQVLNYGPWSKGVVVLSWAFVQAWEGSPTGTSLDTMTTEEIQGIRQFVGDKNIVKVIEYQGNHIPVSQLRVGKPEAGCDEDHWHASGQVESIEGKKFSDPNQSGCGFGKLSEKPAFDWEVHIEVTGLEGLK